MQEMVGSACTRLGEAIGSKPFSSRVLIQKDDSFAQLEVRQGKDGITYVVHNSGVHKRGSCNSLVDAFDVVAHDVPGWKLLLGTCSVGVQEYVHLAHDEALMNLTKEVWKERFTQYALEFTPTDHQTKLFEELAQRLSGLRDYHCEMWVQHGGEYRYIELYQSKSSLHSSNGQTGLYASITFRESPHNRLYYYNVQSGSFVSCLRALPYFIGTGSLLLGTQSIRKAELGEHLRSPVSTDDELYKLSSQVWASLGTAIDPPAGVTPESLQGMLWKEKLSSLLVAGAPGISFWNQHAPERSKFSFQDTNFDSFDLHGVVIHNMNFSNCVFDKANLSEADASNCDLSRSSFLSANLSKCNFQRANLKDVDFSGSSLVKANLSIVDLKNTSFGNADITGVNFRESDIRGVDFSQCKVGKGAKFVKAKYDECTKLPAGVNQTELVWGGRGADPVKLERMKDITTDVTDFDGFLNKIRHDFDEPRVTKALQMLKKDRFQLFSEETDDGVLGVIKKPTRLGTCLRL